MSERDDLIAWNRDMEEWENENGSTENAARHAKTADALESAYADVERLEQENAELRRTLTELRPAEVLVEGSYFPVGELPEVLGNFMREANEYARDAKAMLIQRDAALAVITKAREHNAQFRVDHSTHHHEQPGGGISWTTREARDLAAILSAPPAEALNAVKAEAKAEAFDEAADDLMGSEPDAAWATINDFQVALRKRAAATRAAAETTESEAN